MWQRSCWCSCTHQWLFAPFSERRVADANEGCAGDLEDDGEHVGGHEEGNDAARRQQPARDGALQMQPGGWPRGFVAAQQEGEAEVQSGRDEDGRADDEKVCSGVRTRSAHPFSREAVTHTAAQKG